MEEGWAVFGHVLEPSLREGRVASGPAGSGHPREVDLRSKGRARRDFFTAWWRPPWRPGQGRRKSSRHIAPRRSGARAGFRTRRRPDCRSERSRRFGRSAERWRGQRDWRSGGRAEPAGRHDPVGHTASRPAQPDSDYDATSRKPASAPTPQRCPKRQTPADPPAAAGGNARVPAHGPERQCRPRPQGTTDDRCAPASAPLHAAVGGASSPPQRFPATGRASASASSAAAPCASARPSGIPPASFGTAAPALARSVTGYA